MKNLIFAFYYIYLIIIVSGTAYIVFWKGESGWWFLLTLLLGDKSPSYKETDES